MLNFVDIKEGDSAMDSYEKLIKKIKECGKNLSDDEVAWFDMGDFQIGMNKGLMDVLQGIGETKDDENEDTDNEAVGRFEKYLNDLRKVPLEAKPQKSSFVDPRFTKEDDAVNHPKHYTSGKYECLAVMVDTFGVEAVKNFCKCNAFKYTWRSDKKNGTEDIKKASFYLKFLEGLEEGKSAEEILKNIHG